MRDLRITVQKYSDIIVTVARTAPLETTLIVKNRNNVIEPLSFLKQKSSDVLGTTPTVPRDNPDVTSLF